MSRSALRFVLGVWTALVMFFLIAPIVAIMPIAFSSDTFLSFPIPAFSLRWFEAVLQEYPWLFALRNSSIIAIATVALSVPLGTLAAYGLAHPFPLRGLVTGILISPMIVPVVIVGLSSFFFFSGLGLHGSFVGLIMAHTILALPFVIIPISATLKNYDQNLTRAASGLGSPPWTTFRTVTLPLIIPGVVSGAVFAFITSFDEVVVALFVSSPSTLTLPRQLFSGLRDQLTPALVAIAFLLTVVSCLALVANELLKPRRATRLEN